MTRRQKAIRTLAGLALAGAAAVTTLQAANGDIPIYQPTTITQPGHYVVTQDIASTGGSVIAFGTTGAPNFSNVTLDLNGHTLSTDNLNPVIVVDGALFKKGLTIRNGRLQGGGTGTFHAIHGHGAALEVRIQDLEISNFDGDGVHFDSVGYLEIVRCRIRDIGRAGIESNRLGSASFTGVILGNTLERIQSHGIYLFSLQSGYLKDNVITQFGLFGGIEFVGIYLQYIAAVGDVGGNLIEGNIVTSHPGANLNYGILLNTKASRNLVTDNVVNKNGLDGIVVVSDHNRVERNVASNNGRDGISVGYGAAYGVRNHLEGNQTQGNLGDGACGIKFTNGNAHTYRNNIGGGNTASGADCIPAGNLSLGGNSGL